MNPTLLAISSDRPNGSFQFDVFLSYNSADRSAVRRLKQGLEDRQLSVLLDEEQFRGGDVTLDVMASAIEASQGIVIVLGPNGFGQYQREEVKMAMLPQVREERRVVLVVLPGVAEERIPLHLRTMIYQRLDEHFGDEDLDRLYQAVTGRLPTAGTGSGAPAQPDSASEIEQAVDGVVAAIGSRGITFFLGERASHDDRSVVPNTYQMAHLLLREIRVIESTYDQHLPFIDAAGTYFAAASDGSRLERRVSEVIASQNMEIPPVCRYLAKLLRHLQDFPPRRGRRNRFATPEPAHAPQLIVTTNLDVSVERALLASGVSFTRVVQHRPLTNREVNWHVSDYGGIQQRADGALVVGAGTMDPVTVPITDLETLDELIATYGYRAFAQLEPGRIVNRSDPTETLCLDLSRPILYKYHGSHDVQDSCIISTDHYLNAAEHSLSIPQLKNVIRSTPSVFLGYMLLDPPFRHLYHTCLREVFAMQSEQQPKYLLHRFAPGLSGTPGYDQMEIHNWRLTQRTARNVPGLHVIEQAGVAFVRAVHERLAAG